MILGTQTKIKVARILYHVMSFCRSFVKLKDNVRVRRAGIVWGLSLDEGIDLSIYIFGAFEHSTVKALKTLVKEGDTVFDIGANIGSHTLNLAKTVHPHGHVVAFEPTDFAFQKLKNNLALNPSLEAIVTAEQIYLTANRNDQVQDYLYSSWPLHSESNLHQKHFGKLMSAQNATAERLDDYIQRKGITQLRAIKLDVDGHELQVLQGAIQCLERFRPILVMELAPYLYNEKPDSFEKLLELLKKYKYRYRTYGSRIAQVLNAAQLRKCIPDSANINVILESQD